MTARGTGYHVDEDLAAVVWLPVPDYPGYFVSNTGLVWSTRKRSSGGRLLTPLVQRGYSRVTLYVDKQRKDKQVHALVALAFHGPRPPGLQIRHLNGDPADNRAENLAYGTPSENMLDKVRHGTHHEVNKTHCPQGHPYDEVNTSASRGKRECATCRRQRNQERFLATPPDVRSQAVKRQRDERARLLAADPTLVLHGTVSAYCNYLCRCAPCRAANAEAARRRREKADRVHVVARESRHGGDE